MDDSHMPTVMINGLKDLDKFLGKKHSDIFSGRSSPRQKLEFSDSSDLYQDNSNEFDSSGVGSDFIKKHQQNVAGLDIAKKIRDKDVEILEGKAEINLLESKIHRYRTFMKESRIEHDKEIGELRKQRTRDKEMIEELKENLRKSEAGELETKEELVKTTKRCKEDVVTAEKKFLSLQSSSTEKMDKMREEMSVIRQRFATSEENLEKTSKTLELRELEIVDLEERLKGLRSHLPETQETQNQIDSLQLRLNQATSRNTELQMRLDELKNREEKLNSYDDTIKRLPTLQKELKKLKEENHMHRLTRVNTDLLEEKLSSTENQLKSMENRCNELIAENATLVTIRELNEQYEVALKKELKLDYLPPVAEFETLLKSMQKSDKEVSQSILELKASLESHRATKEEQESLTTALKSDLEKSQNDNMKTSQIIRRLQRKIYLVSKERNNLKDIVASYESEATLNPSQLEKVKISRLEAQLADYKAEVTKLEGELNVCQNVDTKHLSMKTEAGDGSLREEVDGLKAQILRLTEDNQVLKDQMDQHDIQGGINPKETQVLHFSDNPLEKAYQQRKANMEQLKEENESLKKRIKLLEEGENEDLTVKVGAKLQEGASSQKVQELEKKVESLEIRNNRMMEAFKSKANEMREVVYRLTGYRVDLKGDKHYKLMNIYSDSGEDYFLFEQTTEGDLQLLETDYSTTLGELIEEYLYQDNSYPAFLSALTLDLFKKQAKSQDREDSSSEEEREEIERDEEDDDDDDDVEGMERLEEEEGEGQSEDVGRYDDEYEEDDDDEEVSELEEEDDDDEEEEDYEEEEREEDGHPPSKRFKSQTEPDDDDDNELICLD